MIHAISLAIVLAILWLLLSGHFFDPLLLGLGAASILAVVAISGRMQVLDHEGHPMHLSWRGIIYWPWLLKEIVVANVDIAKAIIGLPDSIAPSVIKVRAAQRTELGRVIYANSITLTPGTVTIAVDDDILTVHALTQGSREGVESGVMDRWVAWMEGKR